MFSIPFQYLEDAFDSEIRNLIPLMGFQPVVTGIHIHY